MRDLGQDADAVAGFSLRIFSCPVLQFLYDLQRVVHQGVAGFSRHVDDRTDPAVVMFERRIVKSVLSHFVKSTFLLLHEFPLLEKRERRPRVSSETPLPRCTYVTPKQLFCQ